MHKTLLTFAIILTVIHPLFALGGDEPTPLAQEINQAKLNKALADMQAVDTQIETRMSQVMDALKRIEDSRMSGQQVIEMKRDALRALGDIIGYCHERINRLSTDMREIDLPLAREQIAREITYFYNQMEKRIADVVTITASLARHAGSEAYLDQNQRDRAAGLETAQGGAERDHARNAELLHSRAQELVAKVTEKLKEDAINLKMRADDLTLRTEALQDEQLYALVQEHIAALNQSVETRIGQIRQAQTPDDPGTPIGNQDAQKTQTDLKNFGGMIRKDYEKLDQLRREINALLLENWKSAGEETP